MWLSSFFRPHPPFYMVAPQSVYRINGNLVVFSNFIVDWVCKFLWLRIKVFKFSWQTFSSNPPAPSNLHVLSIELRISWAFLLRSAFLLSFCWERTNFIGVLRSIRIKMRKLLWKGVLKNEKRTLDENMIGDDVCHIACLPVVWECEEKKKRIKLNGFSIKNMLWEAGLYTKWFPKQPST